MSRPLRIAAVTAGLLAAGALAGAVAADVAVSIALTVGHEPIAIDWTLLSFVGSIGAIFGGVLLPVTAWIFLRRVPIGLALLGLLLGTIAGGVLGWTWNPIHDAMNGGVYGAVLGFAAVALLLRVRASAPATPRISVRG